MDAAMLNRDNTLEVNRGIAKDGLIRRLRVDKERLQYKLDHDQLTGAFTKEAFQRAVEADQQENPSANRGLIFIDLGNFKAANKLLGHTGADEILKSVAALFRRVSDMVCRFGGDEFAIYIDTTVDDSLDPKLKRKLSAQEELDGQVKRIVALREAIVASYPVLDVGSVRFYISAGGLVYDSSRSYDANLAAADAFCEASKEGQQDEYGKYREVDLG